MNPFAIFLREGNKVKAREISFDDVSAHNQRMPPGQKKKKKSASEETLSIFSSFCLNPRRCSRELSHYPGPSMKLIGEYAERLGGWRERLPVSETWRHETAVASVVGTTRLLT